MWKELALFMPLKIKPVTGSIHEKCGSWYAVLNVTDVETFKRKPKWKIIGKVSKKRGDGGLTEKQAYEQLPRFIVEADNEQKALFEKLNIQEGLTHQEYMISKYQNTDFYEYVHEYVERSAARIALKTYISYNSMSESRIKDFFQGKYLVKDIDYFVLEEFFGVFDKEQLTRSTKTRYKALLNLVLREAINKEIIHSNPIDRFPKGTFGKSRFKANNYDADESATFLERLMKIDDITAKPSAITLYYAMRREEVLGWKWSQIDFEKKTVSLETTILDVSTKLSPTDIKKRFKGVNRVISTKGRRHIVEQNTLKTEGSSTKMPLLDSVCEILKELKTETEKNKELFGNCYDKRFEEFVFVRPDGYIITPSYLTSHFPILLKNLNMKRIRFHDIRHTTATLLLKDGWSIKHIQEWLRHSDPATTAKFYVEVDEKEKQKVGNALNEKFKLPKKEA